MTASGSRFQAAELTHDAAAMAGVSPVPLPSKAFGRPIADAAQLRLRFGRIIPATRRRCLLNPMLQAWPLDAGVIEQAFCDAVRLSIPILVERVGFACRWSGIATIDACAPGRPAGGPVPRSAATAVSPALNRKGGLPGSPLTPAWMVRAAAE